VWTDLNGLRIGSSRAIFRRKKKKSEIPGSLIGRKFLGYPKNDQLPNGKSAT
jgi:hypothetical protein